MREDVETLDTLSVQATLSPLFKLIEKFQQNLADLETSVMKAEFAAGKVGPASELYRTLISIGQKESSETSGIAWSAIRGLAISLNNDRHSPTSARILIEGLISASSSVGLPLEVEETLRADLQTLQANELEQQIDTSVKKKQFTAAITALDRLLETLKDPEKRSHIESLRQNVASLRSRRRVRHGIFACIALFVVAMFVVDNRGSSRRDQAPSRPEATNAPKPPPTPRLSGKPVEEAPPVGAGRSLSLNQLRYCHYESFRMEVLKDQITGQFEIDQFNALVENYNSRCGEYRYSRRDLDQIKQDLTAASPDLRAQAQRMLSEWRSHSIRSAPQLPSPDSGATVETAPPAPRPTTADIPPPREPPQVLPPKLGLLLEDEAAQVQKRLNELGYLKERPNGAWGPRSRAALAAFKGTNGLLRNDAWDSATEVALFGARAIRSSSGYVQQNQDPAVETSYPPPTGGTLNPLNSADAQRINSKLREYGFYKGKMETVWSRASREALKSFKGSRSLPSTDEWDAATESAILYPPPPLSFDGVWGTEIAACPSSQQPNNLVPMYINSQGAKAGDTICRFEQVSHDGATWKVQARCGNVRRGEWVSNIRLTVTGDQLLWDNAKTVVSYLRCAG